MSKAFAFLAISPAGQAPGDFLQLTTMILISQFLATLPAGSGAGAGADAGSLAGPGQYTLDGIEACGGSLAGPVPCDVRDRSLSPEHMAEIFGHSMGA